MNNRHLAICCLVSAFMLCSCHAHKRQTTATTSMHRCDSISTETVLGDSLCVKVNTIEIIFADDSIHPTGTPAIRKVAITGKSVTRKTGLRTKGISTCHTDTVAEHNETSYVKSSTAPSRTITHILIMTIAILIVLTSISWRKK